MSEISSLYLASEAEQAGLCLTWSQTPEDRFLRDRAHLFTDYTNCHLPFLLDIIILTMNSSKYQLLRPHPHTLPPVIPSNLQSPDVQFLLHLVQRKEFVSKQSKHTGADPARVHWVHVHPPLMSEYMFIVCSMLEAP